MNAPPLITIFVRHSADCKYAGDEFCKRCSCRKHLRWTQGGKQYRRKAGTRSWQEAEEQKRRLEDQLAGRTPTTTKVNAGQPIDAAVKLFLQDKTTQGLSSGVLDKYLSASWERLAGMVDLRSFRCSCDHEGIAHRLLRHVARALPIHRHTSQGARALPVFPPLLLRSAMAHSRTRVAKNKSE